MKDVLFVELYNKDHKPIDVIGRANNCIAKNVAKYEKDTNYRVSINVLAYKDIVSDKSNKKYDKIFFLYTGEAYDMVDIANVSALHKFAEGFLKENSDGHSIINIFD